jgi:hypothetical protein
METIKPTQVVFVDPASWWAMRLLNQEAFAERLRDKVVRLAHTLAVFRLACDSAAFDQVPRPWMLIEEVQKMMGPNDQAPRPGERLVVVSEKMSHTANVYAMLITAKNVFDAHAPLLTMALDPKEVVKGFNKQTVNGTPEVVGGKVLNWLDRHSRREGEVGRRSGELHALFDQAVREWLGTAVKWRDDITHHGGLNAFVPLHAPVNRTMKTIQGGEVIGPLMPDGTHVVDYTQGLLEKVVGLVTTSIRLLPEVDPSRLGPPTLNF